MPRKASFSKSQLAHPKKLIHALAARVQDYFYYPDPRAIYLMLGSLVGNMMKGKPLWIMLVGPPSSGRTLILETLQSVPRVHSVNSIKSVSALLSGTGNKERAKNATGGLLPKIGLRGMIIMKDFTDILSLNRDAMMEIVGGFRGVFDGQWSRDVGTDGGKSLTWGYPDKGRLGFIGASTPKIDAFHGVIQELGQRWLYYRFPRTDGFGETMSALAQRDMEAAHRELRDLMAGFVESLEIDWDSHEPRMFTAAERNRLYAMSSLMVAARSQVSRDLRTHDVNAVTDPEGPPRMAGSLGQLLLGLEVIGLEMNECWSIVGKVALDSAPQIRVSMIRTLVESPDSKSFDGVVGVELKELRSTLKCGAKTIEMTADDLKILGVVMVDEGRVRLSEWASEQLRVGWRGL